MHPLNNGSQVTGRPARKPKVGTAGYFTEKNDKGEPSYPGHDWFNDVIDEFINALKAYGVEFNATKLDNLQKLFASSENKALEVLTGMTASFHTERPLLGWVDAKGGELSRTTDAKLWAHAQASGLLIEQASKNKEPKKYAMYFGTGNGNTTFTLPNLHLGHFTRGNPSGVAFGSTQGDAIRNITAGAPFVASWEPSDAEGALYWEISRNIAAIIDTNKAARDYLKFDASRVVPTANENRPYTANLCIKIFRGFIS